MLNFYEYKNDKGEQLYIHHITMQNNIMYAISTHGKPILWDELIKYYRPKEDESPPMVAGGMPKTHMPCCSILVEGLEKELDKIFWKPEGDDFIKRRKILCDCIHPLIVEQF